VFEKELKKINKITDEYNSKKLIFNCFK